MSYDKYIKYKTKYLQLKAKHVQQGGAGRWTIAPGTMPITPTESKLLDERKSKGTSVNIGYSYVINSDGRTGTRTSIKNGIKTAYAMQRGEKIWTITSGTTPITPTESEFLDEQRIPGAVVNIGYSYVINPDGITGTRTSTKGVFKMNYITVPDASPASREQASVSRVQQPSLSSFARTPSSAPGGRAFAPPSSFREGQEFKPSPPSFHAPQSPLSPSQYSAIIVKYVNMIHSNKAIKLSPAQLTEFRNAIIASKHDHTLSTPKSPEYYVGLDMILQIAETISNGKKINISNYEFPLSIVKKYL